MKEKNLVAGSRRDKNLREIISPTVQKKTTFIQPSGPKLLNGSSQCENFKNGRKCELCSHMSDAVCFVTSQHFNTKHRIKGHLVHLPRDQKFKDRWFIYMIEDNHCKKQYVGSTTDMYGVGLPTSRPVTLAARRLVCQPTSPMAAQGTLAGGKRTLR